MFNFLVTNSEGAWDLAAYEYGRERFLEHTDVAIRARFESLGSAEIEEIKSLPALFAYEGEDETVRVGYIRNIKERPNRSIVVEYEFDDAIPAFSFNVIGAIRDQLGIGNYEMRRTHWAIKDVDLFEFLNKTGLIGKSFENTTGKLGRVEEMNFKVALSFCGDQRDFVLEITNELKKHLPEGSIFYDNDFVAQLARPNLDDLLQTIYLKNSDLIVVFLSAGYENRDWCRLEWRAVKNIVKSRADSSIMYMRFDQAEIPGSLSIDGYVDLTKFNATEAAKFILERVRLNETD